MSDSGKAIERLIEIMRRLRAPDGCPWDREQDLRSLRPYLVEETYEVLDEMDRVAYGGAWAPYAEELGDLLFQIVFHAQLAHELGEFAFADVANAIADKIESSTSRSATTGSVTTGKVGGPRTSGWRVPRPRPRSTQTA